MPVSRARLRAVFAIAAVAVGLVALPAGQAKPPDGTGGKVAGIALHSFTGRPMLSYSPEFGRLRSTGMNTLSIDVYWVITRPDDVPRPVPGITANDADIRETIAAARKAGMRTMLTLKVIVLEASVETWRGNYRPSNPGAFFNGYRVMVRQYAQLARENSVWLFVVGSEMKQAEVFNDHWRRMVAEGRHVFRGPVAYQANWDSFWAVPFWDAVDVIALSAYVPLSNEKRPSVEQLKAGWHNYRGTPWFHMIGTLAARWKKPVLFGEAGYLASTYVGRAPYSDQPEQYDGALQARAYQALLEIFSGQHWWAGVVWWRWDTTDGYRSPRDKPAETLLKQWYAQGLRPGDHGFRSH